MQILTTIKENVIPDKLQTNKWLHNLIVFLAPLGILYLTGIIGILQTAEHVISFADFIPNQFVAGGIALYILNSILDYLRKIRAS